MSEQNQGEAWLRQLLDHMGYSAGVEMSQAPDGVYWLNIDAHTLTAAQVEALIGDRGHVIDAIQYLANTLLNIGRERELQHPYTVELAGYRVRRQGELEALVVEVSQQVRATGEAVELPDLSAAERRQIHHLFMDSEDLTSESRGAEPHRRLFVLRRTLD